MEWVWIGSIGFVMFLDLLLWYGLFIRSLKRRSIPSGTLNHYPSITVIRPVRGTDVGQRENFLAALDTGYPGEVETIFVFDDASDPGLPQAIAAIDEYMDRDGEGKARIITVGAPPQGRTGKLNAMIRGLEIASGDIVAFGDSDTRPDKKVLRRLVEALIHGGPDVGSTFAPVVVGGATRWSYRTVGDVGYALLLNSLYGPTVAMVTGNNGEVPFIMGQLMVVSRRALSAIGGLACAQGNIVDDMYLGRCMVKAGYRNLMIDHYLPIITEGLKFTDFLKTYRRWLVFGRGGMDFSFTWPFYLRGLEFFVSIIMTIVSYSTGHPWVAAIFLMVFMAHGISYDVLQRRLGGPPVPLRHKWMLWGLLLLSPLIVLSLLWSKVDWRGRNYSLDTHAKLKKRVHSAHAILDTSSQQTTG